MSVALQSRLRIDLVPRTGLNQFDIAFRWVGRNLGRVYRPTLAVAVVAGLLSWLLVGVLELDVRVVVPVVGLLTWPLSVDLGRSVAVEAFERSGSPRSLLRDSIPALWNRVLLWGGFLMMLYPYAVLLFLVGILLHLAATFQFGLVGSFGPENGVLDRRGTGRARERTAALVKQERSDLFLRMHGWTCLWILIVLVMLVGTEMLTQGLFQWSPFLQRTTELTTRYGFEDEAWGYLVGSPNLAALLAFWAVLVYPVIRVAWTFAFVDLRIRRDLWDLQRRFHDEAKRLGGGT